MIASQMAKKDNLQIFIGVNGGAKKHMQSHGIIGVVGSKKAKLANKKVGTVFAYKYKDMVAYLS